MATPIRNSFGQRVFKELDGREFSICPSNPHKVLMNGVGSFDSWYSSVAYDLSHKKWERLFETVKPAADRHDMKYHMGFLNDEERKQADKEFRMDCMVCVNAFYSPLMKESVSMLGLYSQRLGPRPKWYQILFNTEKRNYWSAWSEHDKLVDSRKGDEKVIEFLYTMLKIFGGSHCKEGLCYERDLSLEKDVWCL